MLLAVFVSTLILSSFHVHGTASVTADNCVECVKHHCHGHLGQQTTTAQDCVLCHFLTLSFLTAVTVAAVFHRHIFLIVDAHCYRFAIIGVKDIIIPRAPPSV